MNLIERIAYLRELEAKMLPAPWENCYWHTGKEDQAMVALRNAAPKLLGAMDFQPGDKQLLAYALEELEEIHHAPEWDAVKDALRRYQAMAERMEAETNE